MKSLKDKIFSRKEKHKENHVNTISEIGLPTNVVRGIHVSKNTVTGDLEGLPKAWQKLLKTTITEDEQNENPDAGRFMTFSTYMSPVHTYVSYDLLLFLLRLVVFMTKRNEKKNKIK